ncbi:hypothetical protein LG311_10170 [Sutcliffiella horikoshii]|uniref:hypothetical protein n=1 Tax=Sutcliffiella horikoshii TaxID=79883 RepID=UPI00384E7CF9
MKLKVLTEVPYFEQRQVIAEHICEDENGRYSIEQAGLLIDEDLFLFMHLEGVMVDRFKPREDGKVMIGVGHSEVVFPRANEFCETDVDYAVTANMTVGEFFVYLIQLREACDEENSS